MAQKNPKATASSRQAKDDHTTAAIKAIVEEERRLSLEKTTKLRALRLAREATDAEAAAVVAAKVKTPAAKKRAKASEA